MSPKDAREFELRLVEWEEVHELPGDWSPGQLRSLLERLEIEGVADDELLEMVLMGLQDREVDEAADLVLQVVFGDTMSRGVRQNLWDDLQEDRPWEEHADLRRQRGIFTVVTLLQQAFPREFGKPDIARVEIEIRPTDSTGARWLAGELDPALLLRLLAGGMDDRAVLTRLFGDSLAGLHFPEAASILWKVERRTERAESREDSAASAVELVLYSSLQWFSPLQRAGSWKARAWKDAPLPEEDGAPEPGADRS